MSKKDNKNQENKCVGCDFYERYLRGKSCYVGDAPCERCDKRNLKVTWR